MQQSKVSESFASKLGTKPTTQIIGITKLSLNFWKYSTFTLSVVCIILFLWIINGSAKQPAKVANTNVLESPAPQTEKQLITVPTKNTLYLATYDGKDVLFHTNDLLSLKNIPTADIPYTGILTPLDDNAFGYPEYYDFRDLANPRTLSGDFPGLIGLVVDAKYSPQKGSVIVSLIIDSRHDYTQEYKSSKNVIYQIDPLTTEATEIWSTDFTKGVYKAEDTDFTGAANIDQVEGDYLILSLGLCFECSPYSVKKGVLVVNAQTGTEKFLGLVGDVNIDTQNKLFTYKNLGSTVEQCPIDFRPCIDAIGNGQRYVYTPAGPVISDKLP